ncbi:MAG: leucine-rich repeat domain-containing protein, partial [Clostridiales bacterium]|nr:leucine-rich repeat domain-containing protein [Clostridiales bacterium]
MKKRSFLGAVTAIVAAIGMFGLCACDSDDASDGKKPVEHVHEWSESWVYDGDHHWHDCVYCDEIADKAEHDYIDGKCECGRNESGHEHSFGDWENFDDDYHIRDCDGCDETEKDEHSWLGGWENYDGKSHVRTCDYCDAIQAEEHEFDRVNFCYYCGYIKSDLYYSLSDDGTYYSVKDIGTYADPDVVIPDTVNGKPVRRILGSVFSDVVGLSSITVPVSVKFIDLSAFLNSERSLKIYYEGSVADWCEIDFGEYQTVDYDDSKPSHLYDLYIDGALVESLTIPNSVTEIKSKTFAYCGSLKSVTVSDSVTEIGEGAFWLCENLVSAVLPFIGDSAKTAGNSHQYTLGYIFGSCDGASGTGQTVTGGDIAGLEYNKYCIPDSLRSVTVTGGTVLLGAFENCDKLTDIFISDNVRGFDTLALTGCTNLNYNVYKNGSYLGNASNKYAALVKVNDVTATEFEIHKDTKMVADSVFYDCSALNYNSYDNGLYLGNGQNDYAVLVKAKDKSITSCAINEATLFICDRAFKDCGALSKISIPDSVVSIGREAFSGCNGLTEISFGRGVKKIGAQTISDPSKLERITVAENNAYYKAVGNCLIEVANKTLIFGCKNSVIPSDGSVTEIGIYAFYYCDGLTAVSIPDSVTRIGYAAFSGCSDLKRVSLGASVTQSDIVSIFDYSIYGKRCGIEYIEVSEANPVYASVDGLLYNKNKTALVFVPTAIKGEVTVLDGVTEIVREAMHDCVGVTSVVLPSSLK